MTALPNLLIVDDEVPVLSALQRALRQRLRPLARIWLSVSVDVALDWLAERPFHAVVSDLRMPDLDGLEFLARVAAIQPLAVRLLLTGSADFASAQRAVNGVGVFRYLTKPWRDDTLCSEISAALQHGQGERDRHRGADAWALQQGRISPGEAERRRLEALEPGLTQVDWGPHGEVLMPPLDACP